MEGLERLLSEHPFFQGLSPDYLKFIAGCGSNVRFDPGEYLCHENDDARHFFVIRHGRVAIELHAPERGALTIQTLDAGDILGWSWLVPPYKWQFGARAVELVRAVAMDGVCLRGKCEQDHHLGYELMTRFARLFSDRLAATRLQLLDVYGGP